MHVDWEIIKPALWGAAGGAAVLAIVGFMWGGWVTGGTAQKMAEEMAEDAVAARLATICVEHYNQDSEKDQKLEELKEESSWKRREYVEKQGWRQCLAKRPPPAKLLKSVQICLWNSVSRHLLSFDSADLYQPTFPR